MPQLAHYNGLSSLQRQTFTWTNADTLSLKWVDLWKPYLYLEVYYMPISSHAISGRPRHRDLESDDRKCMKTAKHQQSSLRHWLYSTNNIRSNRSNISQGVLGRWICHTNSHHKRWLSTTEKLSFLPRHGDSVEDLVPLDWNKSGLNAEIPSAA